MTIASNIGDTLLDAERDKEIALADAELQKQLTGNESAYSSAVQAANDAYTNTTTSAEASRKSQEQTALTTMNTKLSNELKDKEADIAAAEREYDQTVASFDAQYGSASSNGDTGVEGAKRRSAIKTRDAQYYAARDTSWANTLSGSTTLGTSPWTVKAITAANAEAAHSVSRANAQTAHDAAMLDAIEDWKLSRNESLTELLFTEGQSRETYNVATSNVYANWENGVGNLLGDKPEGTGWEEGIGEGNTETTYGGYGGIGGFLNFNWFGGEDEEESDTPDRPEEPSTAEYVNDNIVLYRDKIKEAPTYYGALYPVERWAEKMLRGWAVDVIAGGVAVAAHDTIKKIEPTPHADEAFILGWVGESSIPTLVSYGNYAVPGTPAIITGNSLDRQGIDYLQSLARDKALELNAGHAQLAVTGTPLMDEVLMEGASAGSAKLLSAGVRLTSKVGRESTELALKTAREFANETAEAASKATQLLDNADSVPLEKVLDDAPKGTAQGLFGIADKPVPGLRNSALKDFYLDQVQSPEFAKRLTRYNWFAERLGVKTASVDEIVKALANNTTFHKTNGFFSAMYERANHGARAAFRIQGTTGKSIFARSTAWHEATHLGAALRGQSDKLFRGGLTHELLVQMTMSPELFGTVVGSTILVVGGTVIVLQ